MKLDIEKKEYTGACLCGEVRFQFQQATIKTIYRCFCSLCRKQGGTSSNTATLIQAQFFHWEKGKTYIQIYKKDTGFTSSFCKQCGSPVPNPLSSNPEVMWIPLGLVQEDFIPETELNFCLNSKASWVRDRILPIPFEELPSDIELQSYFEFNK